MKPRVVIIERQEPADREMGAKVVITLPTQHLLAHSVGQLGLEVQNRAKPEIPALPALEVLRMLDLPVMPA